MKKDLLLLFLIFLGPLLLAQTVITDSDIEAGETLNLTADTEWILDGLVYAEAGATVNIEAGTVIRGRTVPSNGVDLTSSLIITRGAQIFAEGTADAPIIFTAEEDDLSSTDDLTVADNQFWGGLIILGNSIVGEEGGVDIIEGVPSTETRIQYGGDDPDDNSGVLRYVSIRHGGSVLTSDNEINGLTLGGVGSGTEIDYVEVFASFDDGIEIFGGTVNVTHAVVAFVGDDSYDLDESWNGYIQYAFALQGDQPDQGDNAIEYDGSEEADLDPNETGRFYNATFIGPGNGTANVAGNGLRLRNNGNVQVWNSLFIDQNAYVYRIDDNAESAAIAGNIAFGNATEVLRGTEPDTYDVATVDPQLGGISRTPNGGLDPRPNAGSPALDGIATGFSDDITNTNYKGAFNNTNNWALGWTALSTYGFFGDLATQAPKPVNVLVDSDIEAGETLNLTADTEWILDGLVYAEAGATVNIEAGTVIRGRTVPSNGVDLTSSLIITRGAQIFAEGTADAPIIFTAEEDDLSSTDDLTVADNQFWGGLIILGNSIVGEEGGVDIIEGVPSTETRIQYGGDDPDDNSGVLRYVSIRHGGSVLTSDNEINGLTLGGVGSGTEIDYVEVFASFDDGIEIFGGTVNVTHAVVAFVGDDSYDLDESWNGYIQYAFALQGDQPDQGDNAIEYDGSEEADLDPNETGRFYNATFIGPGNGTANVAGNGLRLRNNGNVQVWNSLFIDQNAYVYRIDDNAESAAIAGNYVSGNATEVLRGTEPASYDVTEGDLPIRGVSRQPDMGLNPLPLEDSPILTSAVDAPAEADAASYVGAFQFENWAFGWTALSDYGYFSEQNVRVDYGIAANGLALNVPTPNPVAIGVANLSFELPERTATQLTVFDMTGRVVQQADLGERLDGFNTYQLDVSSFSNGHFVLLLTTEVGAVTRKMTLAR